MVWPFHVTRTFWALMVMPRSRSMSIESRNCSRMSRALTAPHSSRIRSDSVVFPWSMWLMMAKFRVRSWGITAHHSRRAGGGGPSAVAEDPLRLDQYHRASLGRHDPVVLVPVAVSPSGGAEDRPQQAGNLLGRESFQRVVGPGDVDGALDRGPL